GREDPAISPAGHGALTPRRRAAGMPGPVGHDIIRGSAEGRCDRGNSTARLGGPHSNGARFNSPHPLPSGTGSRNRSFRMNAQVKTFSTEGDYKIADISLADWGRKEIDIA